MNDIIDNGFPAPATKTADEMTSLKNIAMVVYVLQALSIFWGVTALVGVIIDYVKREDAIGTVYESHFTWQIRTFWWFLLWSVVGVATIWFGVGFVVLFVAWVWALYRVIKGWLKLNEGKPVLPA
jgi:uncharacterized membrane protein